MTDPRLFEAAARWSKDPLEFVQRNYPWGEGELSRFDGPDVWQADILGYIRDNLSTEKPLRIAVSGGTGPGKGLAVGEPVLTPLGWVPIEHIKVGDLVIAGDGTPTRVMGVYPQGVKRRFRVTTNDGGSVVTDDTHLWLTTTGLERKRHKRGRVRSTLRIMNTIKARVGTPQECHNHLIPTAGIVQHPRALLPVEPYALGFWLGDGSRSGRVGVALPEKIEALASISRNRPHAYPSRPDFIVGNVIAPEALRLLGLDGCRAREKFVPRVYLHGDVSQRTALLQGLLDTDGTIGTDGSICFDSMSEQLADAVAELTRSLGGVSRRGVKRAVLNGVDYGTAYRVYVSLPYGVAPFRLPSKAERYHPDWKHKNCRRTRARYIANVEEIEPGETICIAVDHPSHLYITRDHLVTHNTTAAAWIIDWAMSTCTDCRVQVTANTGTQLATRTWPELSKWHRMSLFRGWFDMGDRRLRSLDPKRKDTWRCDAITWDQSSPEAFRGLHNLGRRTVIVYDEASAIPDTIWEASEGAMGDKDTEIIWLVLGNPTRNTGRFRQCFPGGAQSNIWKPFKIDTRYAKMSNKAQIQEWIDTYGIEHDFVRVNVLSEFPRAGDTQFISMELVQNAVARETSGTLYDPLIVGVDVAYQGADKTVMRFRRGLDARSIPPIKLRGLDPMQVAARIGEVHEKFQPDAIFVDNGSFGAGVVSRCRYLSLPVTGVDFGKNPDRLMLGDSGAVSYYNKRAEMWGNMRDWLAQGGIDNDPELVADLTNVQYGHRMKDGRDAILLERKEDMRKRGLSSTDDGDALALTFAFPIGKSDHSGILSRHRSRHEYDYNPASEMFKIQR